jgi:uncharacterized protein (TIRG00374 family)
LPTETAVQPTGPSLRRIISSAIGIAVSLGLLFWTLKDVSFAEVWHYTRQARLGPLLATVALATVPFYLRIFRWKLLLRSDAGETVRNVPLWHATAIGFMANNILPFRAGEFLRAFSISRLAPVRVTSALSSLVVERLFDGIVIVTLLLIGLFGAGIPADAKIGTVMVSGLATKMAILCVGLLAVAVLVLAFPRPAEAIVRRLVPSAPLAERLVGAIEGIRLGLGALKSPARIAGVVLWSFVIWLVNALSFYAGFKALGISVGLSGALLLQSLLILGIAVPSTPGYVGVFEAAIKAVLALFAVPSGIAVAYALTYHVTTFIPITILGLWSLARSPIQLGAATSRAP